MVRRTFQYLKPLGIALLILALAPCVIEFALRIAWCRRELTTERGQNRVALARSWHTFHELEPLQSTRISGPESEPVEFQTNSLGLRGDEIADPKPPGVFRIICLGDEAILGPELAESAILTRVLEDELQDRSRVRIDVINAGVPGYCPLLSYLQFRHRLEGLDPDLIVAHFDPSDVFDDRRFRRLTDLGPGERPLLCTHPDLLANPVARPLTESFLTLRLGERFLTDWLGGDVSDDPSRADHPRARYAWLADDRGDWTLQVGLALSAYEHLAGFCREAGIRLLLATHPAPWQVSTTASRGARIPEQNGIYPGTLFERPEPLDRVHEFARERNLILCDVTGSFRNASAPDLLFQETTRGFSALGHRLYADQLAAAILLSVDGPWKSDTIDGREMLPASFEQAAPRTAQPPADSTEPFRDSGKSRDSRVPGQQPPAGTAGPARPTGAPRRLPAAPGLVNPASGPLRSPPGTQRPAPEPRHPPSGTGHPLPGTRYPATELPRSAPNFPRVN